jgi:site-specific DNA-methyltransferase (adenine-specific)
MPYDAAATVNESAIFGTATVLGASLRHARQSRKLTQQRLALAAGIDIATAQGLERGRGTLGPLIAVLTVLELRLADQPPTVSLGDWIATVRKSGGYSQAAIALRIGVSKPTVIQIEHGRGNVANLLRVMGALGLATTVVPMSDPLHGARLICGDCMAILPTLPDHSVHAIIADLPYSLTRLAWDRPIPLEPLWEQFRRVLKSTGAVVLTASQPFTSQLVMSNPDWFKYAMVWEKTRSTGFLHSKHMPLKKHEDICVFSPAVVVGRHRSTRQMTFNPQNLIAFDPPKRRINGHGSFIGRTIGNSTIQTHTNYPTSVLRFPSEHAPIHETQKPLDLMRYLVRTFSNEGETVLDCCFGSCTTGLAAVMESRQFVGIEKDIGYFQMARERLIRATTVVHSEVVPSH